MIHENIPVGGLETDKDLHLVPATDYVDARNIRNGYGSTIGGVEPAKGNTLVSYSLPPGTDKCIGTVEDKDGKSIIYFLYNTGNSYQIVRFWPDDISIPLPYGRIEKLWLSPNLGFGSDWYIHSAKIVDGKYLYWTDAIDSENGNEPRKLNLEKLSIYEKQLSYTLYFGGESFAAGRQFQLQVKQSSTIIIAFHTFYTVPAGPPAIEDVIQGVADALNFSYNVTAEVVGNSVVITYDDPGYTISIQGVAPNVVHLSPLNHYDVDNENPRIEPEQLTIIKPVPAYPPRPYYSYDGDVVENRVYGYSFKFRYQYVFDDGEVSAWGPESYVPTNYGSNVLLIMDVDNSDYYNKITLNFNDDPLLDSYQWKGIIKGVNIAVKNSNDDIWRLVDFYANDQFFVDVNEIYFYNDKTYSAVASDDASAENVQALKNFSFVPRRVMSIESISDERGNYMLSMFGTLEYYDTPNVKATITVDSNGPVSAGFPASQDKKNHSLKTGGTYRVGVVYEDFWGRQSSVVPLGRVNIPFGQMVPLLPYIDIDFLSDPPSWADRFRIAISENQNQQIYVQAPVFQVKYCIYDSATDDLTFTTHAAGDAMFVAFSFNKTDINSSFLNTLFDNNIINDSGNIFIPEPNDRLQIQYWADFDEPVLADIEEYNFKIIGYNLSTLGSLTVEGFHVFVEFNASDPDFSAYTVVPPFIPVYLCEIYRPGAETSNNLFYEFGPCNPISGGSHGGTISLDQWGDTFNSYKSWINTSFSGLGSIGDERKVPWVQRNKLHDDTNYVMGDFGRAVVYDNDLKEEFFRGRIRSSEIYKPSTSFNGLSDFRGTNYITISDAFGAGKKLVKVESVLLAICEFKTQPIYIGKDRTLDLAGNTFLGRSQELFNIANELQHDYGTSNPESVVNEDGRVYCFDTYKGVVWRYTTGSGQVPISEYGMRNYFVNLAKLTSSQAALGGFQREFGTYYLQMGKEVIGFQETSKDGTQKNKWCGFFDYGNSEYFGWTGMYFISFYQGKLYLHEVGDNATYFGDSFDVYVDVVVNNDPSIVKMFMNIREIASSLWHAEIINTPATASYPSGMESEIPYNRWGLYEGQYRADFLRDRTDPSKEFSLLSSPTKEVSALLRGRFLRGETATIRLQLTNPLENSILHKVITETK